MTQNFFQNAFPRKASQISTIYPSTIHRVCAIQDHSSLEGIECGSYRGGVSRPLRMGALSGNHFQVVIRNIKCNTDQRLVNKSDIVLTVHSFTDPLVL